MPDKIQLARGKAANMPLLADGEPGFTTDTEELYVGYGGKNIPVRDKETLKLVEEQQTALDTLGKTVEQQGATLEGQAQTIAEQGAAVEGVQATLDEQGAKLDEQGTKLGELGAALDGKLSATAVAAQNAVGTDAELGAVIEALNALITAMKTSGVMQT